MASRYSLTVLSADLCVVAIGLFLRLSSQPVCRFRVPVEQAERNSILTALGAVRLDIGRYPTADEGLHALIHDPGAKGWSGPYLQTSSAAFLASFDYDVQNREKPTVKRKHRSQR